MREIDWEDEAVIQVAVALAKSGHFGLPFRAPSTVLTRPQHLLSPFLRYR